MTAVVAPPGQGGAAGCRRGWLLPAIFALLCLPGYARQAAPPAYAGTAACKTCHAGEFAQYQASPHAKTALAAKGDPKQPNHQGCEGCHGPGAAHISNPGDAAAIFSFKTAPGAQSTARCLGCHATGREQTHYASSTHAQNHVNCLDCHSAHHPQTARNLLVAAQPQLCYSCHLAPKTQFNQPSHHRVNEGLVQCSDCHNPHGSPVPRQLRTAAAQDAVCYTCHADKRGPFVFEHAPVKTEGCQACHVPHGSPNPHLLKTSNVNLLCLQCHTLSSISKAPGTPSFHNQAAQYQACTMCHSQIHGSHFDRTFFK